MFFVGDLVTRQAVIFAKSRSLGDINFLQAPGIMSAGNAHPHGAELKEAAATASSEHYLVEFEG